ncbi:MAG: squalene/phytoene synthase family protein [Scytolyngbya sp. HA4215-MV1]|jgi:phytoene synthase|nr:squalene/phytoene synthase family protein [Scytolyngbya sp. HA4215-MV1]
MYTKISYLVGSSQYRAVADDALKDEDNAAWVMELEPEVRDEWIKRIGWIRLVDRLAENNLLDSHSNEFQDFHVGWNLLQTEQRVDPNSSWSEILEQMQARWFGKPGAYSADTLSIQSWNTYLIAISRYHKNGLVIETLDEYEAMLEALAGAFFQVLPFLPKKYWQSALYFGVVDQFYNNLRDLWEDASQGICYFPTELLEKFKVSREEILHPGDFTNPGYYRMMLFWLDEYLPKLRQRAYGLALANDLHPSWQILRDWSLHRYRRIERIFRRCQFDYVAFPEQYWVEVKRELKQQLRRSRRQVKMAQTAPTPLSIVYLNQPTLLCYGGI